MDRRVRGPWPVALATAGAALLLLAGRVAPAAAADPAATRPPTCAERYPADGPAGIDLRVACALGEVVGLATGAGEPADPAAAAAGLRTIGAGLAVVLVLAVAWRLASRRAGRALAPAAMTGAWSCAACRSVNLASASRCYACGAAPPRAG